MQSGNIQKSADDAIHLHRFSNDFMVDFEGSRLLKYIVMNLDGIWVLKSYELINHGIVYFGFGSRMS